jgi:DNA primase large subunit
MNGLFYEKFPFTEKAKQRLKEIGITPEDVPEVAIKKAALLLSRANSNKSYDLDVSNLTDDMVENELMAFPIAKMFISLMRTSNIKEKFSNLMRKKTFNEIVDDKESKDLCLTLADDFKIKYELSDDAGFFVTVPLLEYLDIYFVDNETKLINKSVEGGKVFLGMNDFARFLSEKTYKKIFDSLPIDKKLIPKKYQILARSIDSQLVKIEKKNFDLRLTGKVNPNFFPPCMKTIYDQQLAGEGLSYYARLSLGAFLYQVGMTKADMLTLFSKSPDFKKHIAQYHIDRIYEKELSAPGCRKMKDYRLRVKECDKECTHKHPMQYYLRKIRQNNRLKNKKEGGVKNV